MKKRFPLANKQIQMCHIFVPQNFLDEGSRVSMPSLRDLVTAFPRISTNPQHLDNEWRAVDHNLIPEEMRNIINPETFFTAIGTLRDELGHRMFETISEFALQILSLPTSNVVVERLFSKVNLLKSKIRNKISTSTLTSLILSSEMIKVAGGCVKFKPHLQLVRFIKN